MRPGCGEQRAIVNTSIESAVRISCHILAQIAAGEHGIEGHSVKARLDRHIRAVSVVRKSTNRTETNAGLAGCRFLQIDDNVSLGSRDREQTRTKSYNPKPSILHC